VSLSLRLFGNIFGEDKLLASILGIGMLIVAAIAGTPHPPVGVPLHLPFFFLVVLLSTIQATVFSLLAAIYIVLFLPHDAHGHEETHGGTAAETGGAAGEKRLISGAH
jgi:F-type H+-transporting ATPase subunit a